MQKRKRLNYIRVAVLVLMAYLKVSKGQITRRPNGLITTELTGLITVVATTAARTTVATTTVATTTITTVFPTTLEPTTPLPALNSPDNFILADVPSNNTVFTVSWDDVQDSRLAVIYNIIVNTLDGPGIETFSDVTSVYTVTGRTPGQEYNVIVVAVDSDNSREEASDEKTLTLRPNIVENLRRHDSSNTSVTSVWNEPLNSVFDSYSIICSSGTAVPITITKDGTLEASCVDVMPGRLHTITVATVSGSQSNSDYVDIWSKPNTVQSLEGDVVTTNSVSVTWSRPDDHTPSYYYIIDCSEGFADNGNITDGTTTATCSPVTAGRVVTVTVTTYSGLESNADSTMVRAKPNSIDALNEESATIDSVTASWRKPAGIVTQYSISCSPGNPQQPVVRDDGRPSKYSATCENISPPGTECTMTVTSVSDTVAGDSRLIKITTYPIPPVLLEAASTERSISVEWQKPNSVVDYYIIECPKGTASPSNITAIDGTLTASCIGLTSPGDTYNISVQSQSNDKLSDAARVIINALPESVTLMKSPSLVDTVSATWARPMGVFEQFYVQCTPSDNAVPLQDVIQFDPDASLYGADCNVSIPGDLYDMTVVSRSGNKNSSSSTLELRALPESVKTFEVVQYTNTLASLSWTMKEKCIPDGGCVWSSFEVSYNSSVAKEISRDSRTTHWEPLTPGDYYVFSISVKSEEEVSSAEIVSQRMRPSNVRSVEITNIEQRVVTIEWERPDGVVTGYNTTIESLEEGRGGGESGGFDGDLIDQKHTATFVDLTPGLEYAITICTKSYDEICITPASISIEALPNKPSAPQDLSLEYEDIHTVRVTFSEPALPNGDITEYIIRYSGVMEGSYNQEEIVKLYTPEGNPPYSVTISDLVAGYTYTFRVTAVNGGGEGEVAEDEITLEQLEPVDSTVRPEEVAVSVDTDIRSFTVMFSSGWFSHCNGELKSFSVFVVEEGGDETIGVPPRSYKEAQNQNPLPVYLAIVNETYPFPPDYSSCASQRKKRQTPDSVEVVIGDGSCSEDGRYCNGALHGNREYKVKYRACNDVGCSETPYSETIKTDLHYLSWSLPLVIIFSVGAIVAFIIWKNRKNPRFTTMLLKRKNGHNDDVALGTSKSRNRTFTTRSLKISEFFEMFHKLMANNCFYMREDFQGLCTLNGKNGSKNVMLTGSKKNPKSCHYHVDFVKIGDGQRDASYEFIQGESSGEFIVCQPPSTNTNYEFWQMLWEQSVHTIIVIGLPQDRKKSPSSYWPSDLDKVEAYQDISVSLTELKKLKPYITWRRLLISRDNLRRHITQVTFTDWPKSGVPDTAETFVEFVKTAKQFMNRSDASTLIHSWNNDGPVGIVLSVYETLLNILSNADATIDIPLSVGSLKLQRHSLVQTLEDFIFIYKCVLAAIEVNAYETTIEDDSYPYSTEIYHSI